MRARACVRREKNNPSVGDAAVVLSGFRVYVQCSQRRCSLQLLVVSLGRVRDKTATDTRARCSSLSFSGMRPRSSAARTERRVEQQSFRTTGHVTRSRTLCAPHFADIESKRLCVYVCVCMRVCMRVCMGGHERERNPGGERCVHIGRYVHYPLSPSSYGQPVSL